MSRDIAISLATLGTRYSAPILAIGAAQFDRVTGKVGATFYEEVEFKSAVKAGKPEGDMIVWWANQADESRRVLNKDSGVDKRNLATALQLFGDWARTVGKGVPIVWGNGATFDISMLEYAYDNGCVGLQEPWHPSNIRDSRTLVDAVEFTTGKTPKLTFMHFDPRKNAKTHAEVLIELFKMLRMHDGKKAAPALMANTSWDNEDDEI